MKNELPVDNTAKKKSWRTSILLHSFVVLLAFFLGCPVNKAVDPNYQIAVTFESKEISLEKASNSAKAEADAAAMRKKAEPISKVKPRKVVDIKPKPKVVDVPKPTPTPPTPTEPIISETTVEDEVEVVAVEEPVEIETPEVEEIPEEPVVEEVVEEEVVEEPIEEETGDGAPKSDSEEATDGKPSVNDGDGTGKGGEGSGAGDSKGDDDDSGIGTGGSGHGEYDDSGNGIFGRRVVYRNTKEILKVGFGNQEGKVISAKFCVNRAGKITYAEILDDETNAFIPLGKEKDVLRGIYGYRVETDLRAPKEECGKLKIVIQEINALIGG